MPRKPKSVGYEVIDENKINEIVEMLVDFAESKKLPAKLVMLAMDIIVSKIRNHLEIEVVAIQNSTDTKH